ncbi:SHOCT domain-containing protein [candidate division KSB1 bacterium]|nr:SHOCT domain-containing protein [candidate division KSB1 bacterium]
MMHDWGWFHWGYGFVVLFWIVLIVLIVWAIKYLTRNRQNTSTTMRQDSPLEILKKRYARGEIDRKEFEEKKKDLLS